MNQLRVVANWEQRRIPHIRGVKPKKNPPRRVIFPHICGVEYCNVIELSGLFPIKHPWPMLVLLGLQALSHS